MIKIGRRAGEPARLRAVLASIGLAVALSGSALAQGGGGGGGGGAAGGAGTAGAAGVGGAAGAGAPGFGGAAAAGAVNTPFGSFAGGNVAGFNPYGGFNPGFNGGINPVFGNTSGVNTNFAFNPYSGYNPLLGNPAGIAGFSGTPFGSNALLNNPFHANGPGAGPLYGTNPLVRSPINAQSAGLGSNALVQSPVNTNQNGQPLNYLNNPGLFNPASNASFSNNPNAIATGSPFPGGFPANNPYGLFGSNLNGMNTALGISPYAGFGNGYLTYGGLGLMAMSPAYVGGYPFSYGLGYPSYGGSWGGGYPSFWGGYSPYTLALSRFQRYGLNASRYKLNNARASAAYSAANFYNDLAASTALSSYRPSTGIRPYYNIRTGAHHMTGALRRRSTAAAPAPTIPRDQLIDDQGHVLWPESAPSSPSDVAKARAAADQAVARVSDESRKNGHAIVGDVLTAQDRLRDYGRLALDRLQDQPGEAGTLNTFLASLESTLLALGAGTGSAGSMDIRPDNAAKTGGDVLKESLRKDRTHSNPAPANTKPDADTPTGPEGGGKILRDTTKGNGSAKDR